MNIIYNVDFEKRLKQLNLEKIQTWKTRSWSYVFKYEILKFRENKSNTNKFKTMKCITTYSNLNLEIYNESLSTRDATILCTSAPCLYLKNDVVLSLSISKNTQ